VSALSRYFGIGLFRSSQQRIDLLLQARFGLIHALVAHRLVLAGVPPPPDEWMICSASQSFATHLHECDSTL